MTTTERVCGVVGDHIRIHSTRASLTCIKVFFIRVLFACGKRDGSDFCTSMKGHMISAYGILGGLIHSLMLVTIRYPKSWADNIAC